MQGQRIRRIAASCVALLACLLLPAPAFANMGPPSLLIAYGTALIIVVEIVVAGVETPVLWRMLHVPLKRAIVAAVTGNALSGVIGIPIAYVAGNTAAVFLQRGFGTMVNLAGLVFVILVFFTASFLVELPVIRFITQASWGRCAAAVAVANAASHLGLLALLLVLQNGA